MITNLCPGAGAQESPLAPGPMETATASTSIATGAGFGVSGPEWSHRVGSKNIGGGKTCGPSTGRGFVHHPYARPKMESPAKSSSASRSGATAALEARERASTGTATSSSGARATTATSVTASTSSGENPTNSSELPTTEDWDAEPVIPRPVFDSSDPESDFNNMQHPLVYVRPL